MARLRQFKVVPSKIDATVYVGKRFDTRRCKLRVKWVCSILQVLKYLVHEGSVRRGVQRLD